jgi:Tfp pilus assembly protein PilE
VFCPKCGVSTDETAKFCGGCGSELPQGIAAASPSADEFYKAAIGPKNQDYYLNHFNQFDKNGKAGITWNWPALFVPFYWFLYRKMWLNALIYFFLPYIAILPIAVIAGVAGNSAEAVVNISIVLYFAALFLLPPMYANTLYYNHCNIKIREAQASSRDTQRQLGELKGRGGTSRIVWILALIFVFVFVVGILAAIAIPAYQQYTVRARTSQAIIIGNAAAESVETYYHQHRKIPTTLSAAGFSAPLPPSVKEVSVDNQTGAISITMASDPIAGQSFQLMPSVDANDQIIWKCMSVDIPEKYLPRQCRQQQ